MLNDLWRVACVPAIMSAVVVVVVVVVKTSYMQDIGGNCETAGQWSAISNDLPLLSRILMGLTLVTTQDASHDDRFNSTAETAN